MPSPFADKSSTDNESLNIARRPSFGNSKATGVTPPPLAIGGGATTSSKAAQRRSEVKHQLSLIAPSGKLRDKMAVLKVLRLFNLCDIGSPPGEAKDASSNGSSLSPTQHARMADLSLLLDVVLKTTSPSVQADLIKYGILSQLQTIILRTMMDCFSIVMKKMMRVSSCIVICPSCTTIHSHFNRVILQA